MFRRLFSQYLFPRAKETHLHERAHSWLVQASSLTACRATNRLHAATRYYQSSPWCIGIPFIQESQALWEDKASPPYFLWWQYLFPPDQLLEIGTTMCLPSCLPGICYPWHQVAFFKGAPRWPEQGTLWHLFHFRSIGWVQAGTLWRKPMAGDWNQVVRAST